jgi:hypothetical protein
MKALNTKCWRAISVFSIIAALAIAAPQKGFAQETYTDVNGKTCTISSILVNSCHPLFLAAADKYPQAASDEKSQLLYFEQRVGRMVDVARTYNPPGVNTLSADDIFFATRNPYSYLEKTWKPSTNWADAGGSNATVNAAIDQMAKSIKSIAPKKMFLVIYHEPENDVSGGATGCPTTAGFYVGSAGTPAQYRAMWANVEKRFAALGVTNVVYAMNYMGYKGWNCMVNDLWPGNNLVDWVLFDTYAIYKDWTTSEQANYNEFTSLSDSTHNYLSKPWGIGETGVEATTEAGVLQGYADMKASLDNNTMPNLKERGYYDNTESAVYDWRVGCSQFKSQSTACTPIYQSQQNAFNLYADDPKFK